MQEECLVPTANAREQAKCLNKMVWQRSVVGGGQAVKAGYDALFAILKIGPTTTILGVIPIAT